MGPQGQDSAANNPSSPNVAGQAAAGVCAVLLLLTVAHLHALLRVATWPDEQTDEVVGRVLILCCMGRGGHGSALLGRCHATLEHGCVLGLCAKAQTAQASVEEGHARLGRSCSQGA